MLISEELRQKLIKNTYARELKITIGDNVVINSSNIILDSLEIDSSLMDSETLVFGGCISSRMTVKVIDVDSIMTNDLEGLKIRVYVIQHYSSDPLYPSAELYPGTAVYPGRVSHRLEQVIYTGYFQNAERQKQRNVFEILAYDEIYRMYQTKCKEVIRGYLNYNVRAIETLRNLIRTVLQEYDSVYDTNFGAENVQINLLDNLKIEFQEYYSNYATNLHLSKDLFAKADDNLSVGDVLAAHSELNARFAYIDAYGDLRFAVFYEVKRPTNNPYTVQRSVNVAIDSYNNLILSQNPKPRFEGDLTYKDYYTAQIGYISFPYDGGNSRYNYGYTDDKRYWYVSDNVITKWSTDISAYVEGFSNNNGLNFIFNTISSYRPYSVRTFGEWWIEPGDVISLETGDDDYPTLKGFVLTRRIRGDSGMKVELEAKGSKYLNQDELIYRYSSS